MNQPIYKIGDKVVIKSVYDKNCNSRNYRIRFTSDMLAEYGNRTATIMGMLFNPCALYDCIPDDGYIYYIDLDDHLHGWTSSMFILNS